MRVEEIKMQEYSAADIHKMNTQAMSLSVQADDAKLKGDEEGYKRLLSSAYSISKKIAAFYSVKTIDGKYIEPTRGYVILSAASFALDLGYNNEAVDWALLGLQSENGLFETKLELARIHATTNRQGSQKKESK